MKGLLKINSEAILKSEQQEPAHASTNKKAFRKLRKALRY
jgi:hypothetical protein